MSYLVIDDLRLGMDRRKDRISGTPGALWLGVNGHISRGGDFERRKKFVSKYTLPAAATVGLAQVNGQIFVFGSAAAPAVPAGVNYQRLQSPSGATLSRILDTTTFGGKIYAVAQFDDGTIYHYYDGARVTAWDTISASVSSNSAVASALAELLDLQASVNASAVGSVVTITAAIAGVGFTLAGSATNHGAVNDQFINLNLVQANVPRVDEVRATAQISITAGTSSPGTNKLATLKIDGVDILGAEVDWTTSNTATAAAVAAQINSHPSIPEYTATSAGNVVTIRAEAGTGATPNSFAVVATVGGDVTVTAPATMSGGVTAVTPINQVYTATVGGTFESADIYTLTLDGINYRVSGGAAGIGITALTYNQKVYSVTNSLLYFSALAAPTQWGTGTGNGFINMQNQNAENEDLVGVRQYQNRMAIFSRNTIQIWTIDVDPANNAYQQTVDNTGALSNKSILQYGNIDVFYLNDSGVRSLRARDASNSPAVNDVGVAIDSFLTEFMDTLTDSQKSRAAAVIGPEGRYWLALEKRIFVFSFFPGSKINAWTYYDLVDEVTADVSEVIKVRNRIYMRAGDKIFLYGGDDNATYPGDDEVVALVTFPFLSAQKPATTKGIKGFDIGMRGTWKAELLINPADEDEKITIGTFTKPTFNRPAMPIEMPVALFSLELTCRKAGYAKVTNVVVHFDAQDAA